MADLNAIYEVVKKRNPGDSEFLEAVEEVFHSSKLSKKFIEKNWMTMF